MEFTTFVRKPFTVEAVEVTLENMEELAPLIGAVAETDDGKKFILVNKRLVPNVYRVWPGFWVTKMGDNIHCYSKKVFNKQFAAADQDNLAWVKYMNPDDAVSEEPTPEVVEANVFAADTAEDDQTSIIG